MRHVFNKVCNEQNIMDGVDSSVTKLMESASKVVGGDVTGWAGQERVDLSQKAVWRVKEPDWP